jgi:hypothetical protein
VYRLYVAIDKVLSTGKRFCILTLGSSLPTLTKTSCNAEGRTCHNFLTHLTPCLSYCGPDGLRPEINTKSKLFFLYTNEEGCTDIIEEMFA